jgi:hypothetical protein
MILPLLRTLVFTLLAAAGTAGLADEGSGGANDASQLDKPYVVLVSIDGFRHDYQDRFETPALDRIATSGVRAESLIPVYPTLTFPNHYSIATGLYPANHGLVDNTFYSRDRSRRFALSDRAAVQDGSWYGGDPLWVVAERNGMVSAAFFFVGTEADVRGIRPTYWKPFNASIQSSQRVDQVLEWLALPEERRPHLVTLYFEDVDATSHSTGVRSPLVGQAIARVDAQIGRLLDGIADSPVAENTYIIVVSDHGQADYRNTPPFVLEDLVDLSGMRVVDHGTSVSLYFDKPDLGRALSISAMINERWRHGQAVIPGEAPDPWVIPEGSRFADVIVQADPRYAVASRHGETLNEASHGWPPGFSDMHGVFLATGPRLPSGRRVAAFENIDIYPFVLDILGLDIPGSVDADPETLVPLLQ